MLATVGVFLVATLVWVAPVLGVLETSYLVAREKASLFARADSLLTSWMLAWGAHALRTNPLDVYQANVFHPLPWTLAFSENLLAGALLVLPADVAWGNPTLDHNLLLIASFVLTGTGTALLVRELGGGWPAAWLAGALVAFTPYRALTIGHVHVLSIHWMPFALLAVHRCLRRGRGALAVAAGVLLVCLSSVYYAYFFLFALAVFVPAHWLLGCAAAPGGRARVLAGIAVASALTAVVLLPYMIAKDVYGLERAAADPLFFGARALDYLGALVDPADYLRRRFVAEEHDRWLVGLGTFALMAVGLIAGAPRDGRRTALLYLVTGLALALVSFGPLILWTSGPGASFRGPWAVLTALVPGFSALRVSVRACTVAQLAFGVLAGLGADALWRRTRRPSARAAVLALFLGTALLDGWRSPFGVSAGPWRADGVPAVYRWLAAQPGRDAVLELPLGIPDVDAEYMVMSATHWRPLVNGYSGFTPTRAFFAYAMATFPSVETTRLLRDIGVRWVVVHPDAIGLPAQARLCRAGARIPAHVHVAYRDPTACVYGLRAVARPALPAPDRAVPRAGARVATAAGTSGDALLDGRLDTHWIEAVDGAVESWVQVDFAEPHAIARVVLQLGPHFGEYLRRWRVETSLDGTSWQTAAVEPNATPPLVALRTDPRHLTQELRLPAATPARHLRIVRTGADATVAYTDLWLSWLRWGAHEIEMFEAAP